MPPRARSGKRGSSAYSCRGCALYNPRGAIYIDHNVYSSQSLWGKRVHHPILPSVSITPGKNVLHISGPFHFQMQLSFRATQAYYPDSTDEETEAEKVYITCLVSNSVRNRARAATQDQEFEHNVPLFPKSLILFFLELFFSFFFFFFF